MKDDAESLAELASRIMLELRTMMFFEYREYVDKKDIPKFYALLNESYEWEQRYKKLKEKQDECEQSNTNR